MGLGLGRSHGMLELHRAGSSSSVSRINLDVCNEVKASYTEGHET